MADQMPQPGSSRKPICCVSPSTIAPANVPQNEPMPPMITASNANSSSSGPSLGDDRGAHRLEHAGERDQDERDRRWPARRRCFASSPISSAISRSSGRRGRRGRAPCGRTATAAPRCASSATREDRPAAARRPRCRRRSARLCVLKPPMSSERGSAENISSSRFWITIDSPKVTTSDGSGSRPSVPLSTRAAAHSRAERQRQQQPARRRPAASAHQPVPARSRANAAEHDEVALRDVGQPHHAEHQRQAEREQRVQAAEQHALDQGVDHAASDAEVGLA